MNQSKRSAALVAAKAHLSSAGYELDADGELANGELERATASLLEKFRPFGCFDVLCQLFGGMRSNNRFGLGVYLTAREFSKPTTPSAIPYGFLLNLAVQLPPSTQLPEDPKTAWREAIEFAVALAAILDIQPRSQFWNVNVGPTQLGALLGRCALFDHVFTLRQWPWEITLPVISEFFSAFPLDRMPQQLGWDLEDAFRLCEAIGHFSGLDPNIITKSALLTAGAHRESFDRIINFFAHDISIVNKDYDSPLASSQANLMFKPLIAIQPDTFFLPAASTSGPAFYEALMAAIRPLVNRNEIDDLQGTGTERVFARLINDAGLPIVAANAKYNMGTNADGECDLILADERHIVFLECKAKALTRASMSGSEGAALTDFSLGIIKAHAQALQHERVLRQNGTIVFSDGNTSLKFNGQEITRIALTLLDHGALHDRTLLFLIYETLLRSRASGAGDDKSEEIASKINQALLKIQTESLEIGISEREQAFFTSSASAASLSAYLQGVSDLDHFVHRIRCPMSYASGNQMFDLYFGLNSKVIR
ncbi:hypothetical protein LRC39_21595 [Rhodopseudomonas sp. P1]|uniref:hypothetical protein n=1 Tax=Rhodopseudomonas sp. P1 TaxID=3434357 RepID=UPI0031FC59A1